MAVPQTQSTRQCWRLPGMLIAAAGLALAACASPTPYQPEASGRGFADQSLEADRFRVTFSGNTLTPRETVENYLLYRAAELTLEKGFDHFVVADMDTERHTSYWSNTPGLMRPAGYWSRSPWYPWYPWHPWYGSPFHDTGLTTLEPRERYSASANIVLRKGPKPDDDAHAYDAQAVIDRLGPQVKRPDAS